MSCFNSFDDLEHLHEVPETFDPVVRIGVSKVRRRLDVAPVSGDPRPTHTEQLARVHLNYFNRVDSFSFCLLGHAVKRLLNRTRCGGSHCSTFERLSEEEEMPPPTPGKPITLRRLQTEEQVP